MKKLLFEMKSDEKALSDGVGLFRDDKVAKKRLAAKPKRGTACPASATHSTRWFISFLT